MIYNGIEELVGNTPLLRLKRFCESEGVVADICLKLESKNPAGSTKDRAALSMILAAERSGELKAGGTIIEPTSGNTGIGLAAIGSARGYRVILTMPDSMSEERRKLLKAYGAQLELTPGAEGMSGAIKRAHELAEAIEGSVIAGQFENQANPDAHYRTTAREIYLDTNGTVSAFVAGIGTGGTVTGVGRYLKEQNENIFILGFEPSDSPLITEGRAGAHKLQGIGANFIPKIFDINICDKIVTVTSDEAYRVGREIARTEGVLVGISTGAAVAAAIEFFAGAEWKDKIVVCHSPDSGEHYLSVDNYLT